MTTPDPSIGGRNSIAAFFDNVIGKLKTVSFADPLPVAVVSGGTGGGGGGSVANQKVNIDQVTPVSGKLPVTVGTDVVTVAQSGTVSVGIVGQSGAVTVTQSGKVATTLAAADVSGNLPVSVAGTVTVTQSGAVVLGAGSAAIGTVQVTNKPAVSLAATDVTGNLPVALGASLPAGTNALGSVTLGAGAAAIGSVTVSNTATVTLGAALPASNGNGITKHRLMSAASINATVVKASNARLYSILAANDSASKRYLKLYNKTTTPAPASDTPIMTLIVPAGSTMQFDFPSYGSNFGTGLAYVITGAMADTDTTAIGAAEVALTIEYI